MNKTVQELSDLELATYIRDTLIESQRIQANLTILNQELEARQKPKEVKKKWTLNSQDF